MRQSETLCASFRQGEESGHPPPGDQPQNWRATAPRNGGLQPENWTGHHSFLNTVGIHEFILDFGGYMSEVAHGSGTMVQCLVIMFLSFSSAPLLCPRPLSHLARGVSDGGPFATSLCSLTQAREMLM